METLPKIVRLHLETNLEKIEHLASIREDENFHFRSFLKGKGDNQVDKIVHHLQNEITQQVDCTQCGNCCIKLRTILNNKEVIQLAHLENITPKSYMDKYCEKDVFNDLCLKALPCRYLDGKKCSIYENRPKECKSFPNTYKKGFISRTLGMIKVYAVCPIVFNLMEILKDELRFRR
jgi:Fe-S-cluster containining protein